MKQNINKDSLAHLERIKLIQEGEGSYRQDSMDRETNVDYGFLKKITSEWDVNLQLGK